jgi:mRNA interferase MazF
MRRGDVWWVDLDPVQPSEAGERRPAVVVSGDSTNRAVERLDRGVVTVVPMTSNTSRVLSFQVFVPGVAVGLPGDSKAQAEQVRAVSCRRLRTFVGRLPAPLLTELDRALRLHLDI